MQGYAPARVSAGRANSGASAATLAPPATRGLGAGSSRRGRPAVPVHLQEQLVELGLQLAPALRVVRDLVDDLLDRRGALGHLGADPAVEGVDASDHRRINPVGEHRLCLADGRVYTGPQGRAGLAELLVQLRHQLGALLLRLPEPLLEAASGAVRL